MPRCIFKALLCLLSLILFLQPLRAYGAQADAVLATNVKSPQISRPDAHAPIGVMGDHVHEKGEWMFSYRYMLMKMSGHRDGHRDVDNAEVLTKFPVTPTDMTMQMHMLGLMLAPSDYLTLALMLPLVRHDMEHRTRTGLTFRTNTEGIGDLKLSGLVPLIEKNNHRFHLNMGWSFPLGEIDAHDDLPTGPNQRLPYPMQISSGTWDVLPGLTYNGQAEDWSWGAQGLATVRPGRNHVGYSLGNKYEVTIWGARKWTSYVSQSVGLKYSIWENIGGRDASLTSTLVPTADTKSRGGKRIDFLLGLNLYLPKGLLRGQRLAIDFGIPFMQSLDGPQLEADWYCTAGWQFAV